MGDFSTRTTEANRVNEATRALRDRATLTVASHAHDTFDCARLLDMLGLHPTDAHPRRPGGLGTDEEKGTA